MNVSVFPSNGLFSIQRQVNSSKLTISELRHLEDQLLNTDEAASQLGSSILGQIHFQQEVLLKKEITHLGEGSVLSQVKRVQRVSSFLTPSELQSEIVHLKAKTAHGASQVQAQIERLEFQSVYPLAMDLEAKAAQSTFASRMLEIAEEGSLQKLSATQQEEVLRFGDADISRSIKHYVHNLELQLDAARDFHFGRIEEGERKLQRLPESVQRRIEGLVWASQDNPEGTMTSAILQSLEERMGF